MPALPDHGFHQAALNKVLASLQRCLLPSYLNHHPSTRLTGEEASYSLGNSRLELMGSPFPVKTDLGSWRLNRFKRRRRAATAKHQ